MSAWDHESAELFRSARTAMSPNGGDRARVRARLASKLGAAGLGTVVGATVATKGAAKGTALALAAKVVLPITFAGAVLGGTYVLVQRAPETTSATQPQAVAPPSAPPAFAMPREVPKGDELVEVAKLPEAKSHVAKVAASPAAPRSASIDESVLIGSLDTALRAGDLERARQLATEHERRFPRGVLAEERDGAKVLLGCGSTVPGATANARAFLSTHPATPMRARILASCKVSPSEADDDASR